MANNANLSKASVAILARVGNLVMAWNAVERWMRQFVSRHSGDTWDAVLAATERKGGQLTDRVDVATKQFKSTDAREHVLHFAEAFDRLRQHRNKIVHRLFATIDRPDGTAWGLLTDVNRQGISADHVAEPEIIELVNKCWVFEDYARQIMTRIDKDGAVANGETMPPKPTLPPVFKEIRHQVPGRR